MKKSIMSKVIHFLLVSILLFVFNNCEKSFKNRPYSFFIAGHTYGYPGYDIERNGLHPPFKNRFDLIKENNFIEFGVFLGDIVWEPSIKAWDNVDKDIKELELYLSYRGICLVDENIEENQLFYSISIPCQQLGPNNECKVHKSLEKKPLLYQRYPIEPDNSDECSYKFQPPSPLLPIETNIAQTK